MEETGTQETLQEPTVPTVEGTNETAEAGQSTDAPQSEEGNAEQSEQQADNTNNEQINDNEDFLPVRFMHEERTLNREDAVKYAQMGMNFERFEPMLSKIDYLASIKGVSREQYIEEQLQSQEADMRNDIISKYGEDENTINEMMEFTRQKHKKAYEAMIAQQKEEEKNAEESAETRIAGEFAELVKEFPELEGKTFKDLPAEVKKAGFSGEKLLSAYLYHKHSEGKKIAEAAAVQEKAAKNTAGSMSGDAGATNTVDPFLEGLFGR